MLLKFDPSPTFHKISQCQPPHSVGPTHCFTDVGVGILVGIDVYLRWFHKLIQTFSTTCRPSPKLKCRPKKYLEFASDHY